MNKILVLKTSVDATMVRLFEEIKNEDVYCLIQSSQFLKYKEMYPNITFIDIHQEGFYDLADDLIMKISNIEFSQLYITFSGIVGHNYGNVMRIVQKMNSKQFFFYNCNGERVQIPKKNKMKDYLCSLYIRIVKMLYIIY